MKKILEILATVVMSVTLLAGCGNPVFDDFENYLNVDMVEINENYEKIKTEANSWENIEEDAQLEASLENVLLPLVNDSLSKLEKISPETEEVKEIKDKYVKVMEAYRDGFSDMLAGVKEVDENKLLAGNEEVENGIQLLDEYNKALEALAEQVDAKIEY